MKKFLFGAVFALAALFAVRETVNVVRAGVACSVPFVFVNGQPADATQVNANFNSLVACFTNAASAGANNDITSLSALSTPITPTQGGTQYFWGGTSSGTNTVTVTTVIPTSGFSLTAGVQVCFIPGGTNTGTATLNVNGTGAVALRRLIQSSTGLSVAGVLVGGELLSTSNVTCAVYSGVAWIITSKGVDYVGEIKDFGYAGCPTGWQETTGGTVVAASFPDINNFYGTTWGTSGGNVVMPDIRGRVTFNRDSGGSGRITVAGGNFDGTAVGNTGGGQNQALTAVQLPSLALSQINGGNLPVTLSISNLVWQNIGGGTAFQSNPANNANAGTPTVTISSGSINATGQTVPGTANAHTILSPAAIVTKCVKL